MLYQCVDVEWMVRRGQMKTIRTKMVLCSFLSATTLICLKGEIYAHGDLDGEWIVGHADWMETIRNTVLV